MDIALSYRAKGTSGLAARAGTILSRFRMTARPMERYLACYADLTNRFNAHPTLPITACVLARHPALIARFVEQGVEFAIHGLVHNDHASLDFDEQYESIGKALGIFQSASVPCSGFRGPYLRYNEATHKAVRSLGLRYHCSQAVAFTAIPQEVEQGPAAITYHRALDLYKAISAAEVVIRPHDRHGLIDIPVAIPDDEIMVDRLHLDNETQATTWLAILETTHARGELFTVQLHPERIFDCAYALQAVLEEARRLQPAVWIGTLDEIASWWLRRRQTILTVQQLDENRYRVDLRGDPEVALIARGLPTVEASPWYGSELVARTRSFEVSAIRKPVVGVSTRSPRRVLDFLEEEGLPAEVSNDRARFGAYLDVANDTLDEVGLLAEIERAPGPLVRFARWPGGARSALALTGDIDSITLQDFAFRLWETRRRSPATQSASRAGDSARLPARERY